MPRCAELEEVLAVAKAGDIILTSRPRSKVSALIRLLSGSPVSHSILCIGDEQFVMAHLPRPEHPNDTVIQKYNAGQLQGEEWNRMFCYRHQGLDPDLVVGGAAGVDVEVERTRRAEAVREVLATAERFARDPGDYHFATWDMVVGAVLASMLPAAWILRALERALPGLGQLFARLQELLAAYSIGGEARLFCSEFVSRCFIEAAAKHDTARIDTTFIIMRHWAAILSGEEPEGLSTRRLAESKEQMLDDRDVLQHLAELDEVQPSADLELEFMQAVQELGQSMTSQALSLLPPVTPVPSSALLQGGYEEIGSGGLSVGEQRIMSEMPVMHDVLARFQWPQPEPARPAAVEKEGPDIADFITPADLLRSPSLRAVAWWDAAEPPPAW
jgi:hypothetical protein